MTLDINKLPQRFQSGLRRADASETGENDEEQTYNGKIDSARELRKAFTYLPPDLAVALASAIKVKIDTLKTSGIDLAVLREADSNDSRFGYNGEIDSPQEFIAAAQKLNPQQFLLFINRVSYQEQTFVAPVEVAQVGPSAPAGRVNYAQALEKLVNYFNQRSGDPPNATRSFTVNGQRATALYHVYENDPTHLRNGGGTTSESQALYFNLLALYAALTKKKQPMMEAYNFIRYYMQPHDGLESPQLPDSRLRNQTYAPAGLSHWLIDLSGNGAGDAVFAPATCFNIYDPGFPPLPSIAHGANPRAALPDLNAYWPNDNNTYKFGSATDADQWIVNGYYFATRYGAGNFNSDIQRTRDSLLTCLNGTVNKTSRYPNTMIFGRYWGANLREGWGWKAENTEIYAGYQDPAIWQMMGETKIAQDVVKFLGDAQDEFAKRYGEAGLFMPVWSDKAGGWGWEGPDPNTDWMGFQYRAFAHLATYYYLTGDSKSKQILDKFYAWVKKHWQQNGSNVAIPLKIRRNSASVSSSIFSPDMHGLLAQGLVLMAAKSGDAKYKTDAQKLLDDMVLNHQDSTGGFVNAEFGYKFGFHQAEAGIALGLYQLLIK